MVLIEALLATAAPNTSFNQPTLLIPQLVAHTFCSDMPHTVRDPSWMERIAWKEIAGIIQTGPPYPQPCRKPANMYTGQRLLTTLLLGICLTEALLATAAPAQHSL